jgi:hypothetical protein
MFLTLEDETGLANIIVPRDTVHEYWATACNAPYLKIEGIVEKDGGVVHLLAKRIFPLTVSSGWPRRMIFIDRVSPQMTCNATIQNGLRYVRGFQESKDALCRARGTYLISLQRVPADSFSAYRTKVSQFCFCLRETSALLLSAALLVLRSHNVILRCSRVLRE